jgi:hypothetical protein
MIFGQNLEIPTIVEVVGGFGVHIFSRLLHAIPSRLQHTCYPRRPLPQALTAFYRIAFSRKKAVEQSKVNLGETHSVGDSLTTQKLSKQIW